MAFVTELGASAVLSSHLLADVERVCDYLVVLCASRIQLAGDVNDLLATHHRLATHGGLPPGVEVITTEHNTAIVQANG
ncbi:hypothetical protein [Actinokineospora fastidiosa]|uniref:ABC transporter ATP-binding protein n=1 Tax=Actinokineospora fastidiosa TaxID=1816 RepID=A0A918LJ58_9PSEU|nr:hypothetical protein [Actinokineospora fastidiosa]GGS54383.1 hypothetical protein GCM10010171_56890 [Actinokineospora fastidiosa]